MTTILHLVRKEFLQIFRNRSMLPIIFVMPVVQLIILAHAATYEIRNIPVYLVDQDHSSASRQVVQAFENSPFFRHAGSSVRTADAMTALIENRAKIAVVIPPDFEKKRMSGSKATVQLLVDAVDGYTAGIAAQYAGNILAQNEARWRKEPPAIAVTWSYWYNPERNYHYYMVPGILVLLVTMIGGFLSGMNIVREREIGTMEQLNVTPIGKHHFIIGKLLPFWLLGMAELAFGLAVAWLIFGLVSQGSLALVFGAAAIYLLVILGLGLMVSTMAETQQQAMFVTWFIMVIFILMSGLFTPIESMPDWARALTLVNPVAWFIDVMRRVMLTGAGLADVLKAITVLSAYAIGIFSLAVIRYSKTQH